jgi:hypothetical protein
LWKQVEASSVYMPCPGVLSRIESDRLKSAQITYMTLQTLKVI